MDTQFHYTQNSIDLNYEKDMNAQLWNDIFKQHSAVMILVDPEADGQIVDANPSATKFYGYSLEQFIHMKISDINVLLNTEVTNKMEQAKANMMNEFIFKHRLSNGQLKSVQVFSTLIHSMGKNLLFSIIHDITDRIQYEKELMNTSLLLKESEQRYRFITENSTDMIAKLTPDMTYTFVSSACHTLLGYEPEELVGKNPLIDLIHPEEKEGIKNQHIPSINQQEITTSTHRIRKKDGSYTWFETTSRALLGSNEEFTGFLAVSRDTSQRREAEEKLKEVNQILEQFSFLDGLTGISNRRTFDELIQKSWKDGKRLPLIMIDVDQFKNFNDTYGHQNGDTCLKRIAGSLSKTLKRKHDFVARYGGEEFVVVLSEGDETSALLVAEQLRRNVENLKIPHSTSVVSQNVTISLGICPPFVAENIEDLIEKADKALYFAKRRGRNQVVMYDNSLLPISASE